MTFFFIIGIVGIVVAAISLFAGDVLGSFDFDIDLLDSDFFSTASIAGFLGAFGFGGAATLALTHIMAIALGVGLLAGIGFAYGAVRLARFLKEGERSDAYRSEALIGADAVVITDIPSGGFGEIKLSVHGTVTKLSASSAHPIGAGTEVWVSGVTSPTAVVVSLTRGHLEH